MSHPPRLWIAAVVLLALLAGILLTQGPPGASPNPPGTFSFAVLGDAPYYPWEDLQYRLVLQEMDAHDLSWVLHVGDIFWRPCTDALYRRNLNWYNRLRHPVIYTPGDNEWADCWETGSGSYAPLERLARLREIFFAEPEMSLGGRRIPLESQGAADPGNEFVENRRWVHEGIVFATVHLVGSWNAGRRFDGRTEADDEHRRLRTEAAASWIRGSFAEARTRRAPAVVLGFQANPGFEDPVDHPYRMTYEPFITVLEEEAEAFGNPVLLVHGEDHEYLVDHPLARRTTGRTLENLTRMQVPGSPEVGWVRVIVDPGPPVTFSFEKHVVPRWKFW